MESPQKPTRGKLTIVIASIAVVAIVFLSVLFVYYSPNYSWSSSIRDHDGDGVPDNADPRPLDAGIWHLCEGYINLTIHNNLTEILFLNRVEVSSTDLIQNLSLDRFNTTDPDENLTQLLKLNWLGGPVSIDVSVSVHGAIEWSSYAWDESLSITQAHTTTVSLICPDDFVVSHFTY